MILPKGYEVRDPKNSNNGYRLTKDLRPGDPINPKLFEAIGDAPKPEPMTIIPKYVIDDLKLV